MLRNGKHGSNNERGRDVVSDPGSPIDFSEFSAEVARQAGVSEGELSPRNAGQPPDELEAKAQRRELPHLPDRRIETVDEALQLLSASYERTVEILENFPGIKNLGGRLTFTDVIGEPQPLLTWDTVEGRFHQQKDLLMKKMNQGFTRLVLVPFGASTKSLVTSFLQEYQAFAESGALPRTDGKEVHACKIDDKNSFLAAPIEERTRYELTAEMPAQLGRTKKQILRVNHLEGWKMYLAQDPLAKDSEKPPLMSRGGMSPQIAREKLADEPDRAGEQLLTIETHTMLSYLQLCEDASRLEMQAPRVAGGTQDPEGRMVPVVMLDTDASHTLFYRIWKLDVEGIPHRTVEFPTVVPIPLGWWA